MQEVVNFLIENPDVLEKVVNGQASILGVDLEDVLGLVDGILGSSSLKNLFWA